KAAGAGEVTDVTHAQLRDAGAEIGDGRDGREGDGRIEDGLIVRRAGVGGVEEVEFADIGEEVAEVSAGGPAFLVHGAAGVEAVAGGAGVGVQLGCAAGGEDRPRGGDIDGSHIDLDAAGGGIA